MTRRFFGTRPSHRFTAATETRAEVRCEGEEASELPSPPDTEKLADNPPPQSYQSSVSRAEPWTIADVIDLEYLLAADSDANDERLRQRDREIFELKIRPKLASSALQERRAIFKAWLNTRRAEARSRLPGQYFSGAWQTLLWLGAFIGVALGGSVTVALLHYKGAEPVNVAVFLGATVGVQLLILAAVALAWLLRRAIGDADGGHPLRWLVAALLWSFGATLQRLPGEQRERLRAAFATIGHKREIYGSLAVWPLLIVTQVFAVSYNTGILATLLAHVAATDLAFGWQSTLHASPEQVHRLVCAISAPWAWLVPNAHPTFEQIVGSRFQYSAGLTPLSSAAMASWWPFLCYAVVCYGLLPRAALLVLAGAKLRRALRSLAFDEHDCNALFRRLTGPLVEAQSSTAALQIPETAEPALHTHSAPGGDCFTLVATDAEIADGEIAAHLAKAYGWRLVKTLPVQIDHPGGNSAALAELRNAAPSLASVVVVAPAERDPIVAIARCLKEIIDAAGAKPEVLLLLTGERRGAGFAPVPDERVQFWRNLNAIHRLHAGIECWSAA
jgi:uncharacterized protein DUF2868